MPDVLTTEMFIERAHARHGDKYDYSKVKYEHSLSNVTIICPKHGRFMQQPTNHLSGHGCPECNQEHRPSVGLSDLH